MQRTVPRIFSASSLPIRPSAGAALRSRALQTSASVKATETPDPTRTPNSGNPSSNGAQPSTTHFGYKTVNTEAKETLGM